VFLTINKTTNPFKKIAKNPYYGWRLVVVTLLLQINGGGASRTNRILPKKLWPYRGRHFVFFL
jgi:hypothetical protein